MFFNKSLLICNLWGDRKVKGPVPCQSRHCESSQETPCDERFSTWDRFYMRIHRKTDTKQNSFISTEPRIDVELTTADA